MLSASRLVARVNNEKTSSPKSIVVSPPPPEQNPPKTPTALRQIHQKHDLARKSNIYRPKNT